MNGITKGSVLRFALVAGLSCATMFAQGPLTSTAQGVSAEVTSAIRYIAILIVIGLALWISVSHNHGVLGRVVAGIIGLFVALNPTMVTNWIQGL